MKRMPLMFVLLVIIIFTVAGYYFIAQFGATHTTPTQTLPTISIKKPALPCQKSQLAANISFQGAAGNIFATITMTNTGKTACTIVLGNSITAMFEAKNILIHYIETVTTENFLLAPSATAYSQIHYPNGPQCQSEIKQQPVTFLYKTDQTALPITPNAQTEKPLIQACSSETEKTIIDIWPLAKQPITP